MGIPDPAIRMPVWPVARKVASIPRSRIAAAKASAVYFLPKAQSVPTVSNLFPPRLTPRAIGISAGGTRTSINFAPDRCARSRTAGISPKRSCIPEATSSPRDSASSITLIIAVGIRPPTTAMPRTNVFAPCFSASSTLHSGTPRSTASSVRRSWPRQFSRSHWTNPAPVLAYTGFVSSPTKTR